MKWYGLAKPTGNLFVHFDKNVYANNETVYFTGYLIKASKVTIDQHRVMALALIRNADNALILEDKFLFNNGVAFGSILIPDSILTGGYHFLVYSDKLLNGMPEVLFIQNITLKTNIDPAFKANLKIMPNADTTKKQNRVLISVTSKDDRFLSKPATISYNYGNLQKETITDASGQLLINLPPQPNIVDPNLYVKLKYERDSSFINLAIPRKKNTAQVKFYPEGGDLVAGLTSNVSWEVKDQQNLPLALTAFLYKDQQIIDTITTSSYGIGKFKLSPESNAIYSVKLLHSALNDTLYHLPASIDKGLALTIQNAFVKDTLKLNLKTNGPRNLTLMVHNFRESYIIAPLEIVHNQMTVKIPLYGTPKGLATITILDSLDRPLAERMFFAHYDSKERITITTDQQVYKQREKVSLKLNLTSEKNALVSIACVQNNRLELKNTNDIESYTYLSNELSNLPIHVNGNALKDPDYLEQILLVKGWRRYTWQGLQASNFTDTIAKLDSVNINGQVTTPSNKNIKTPFDVGLFGSRQTTLITTTTAGLFNLSIDNLITPAEKKLYAFVNSKSKLKSPTSIVIDDGYTRLSEKLAKLIKPDQQILSSSLQNNTALVLKNNERIIRLKEVVIGTKNDNNFNYSGANPCGDYVCSYNILNCKNHINDPRNKPPIAGKQYYTNGVLTLYPGCNILDKSIFFSIKGIHLEKEFYLNDYKDSLEPAFFSTIYWNYGTVLQNGRETELSFYTSDITGKFRVVVQGITDNDVLYEEHFFEVKGK
ncbi:MAG: hypothetical protein V4541_09935 [Bacteroidota bacterium]